MIEQIKLLTKMELCNLYGFNVVRHTKDGKEKRKAIAQVVLAGLVLLLLVSYVVGFCYGLIIVKAGDMIPVCLIAITCLITLIFGSFKAGGVIFQKKGYEMLCSLPLSKSAVVVSRFVRLYTENLMVTLLIMLPGMVVFVVFFHPGIVFWVAGMIGIFIMPLIPTAVATGFGALVAGISSHMKHKALVEAGTMVMIVLVAMFGSASLSDMPNELAPEAIRDIADMVGNAIGNLYPPAVMLGNAMVFGDIFQLLLFVGLSVILFTVVVMVVAVKFDAICHRLYSVSAKHDYKLETLHKNSVLKALVLREAKRYFSSGIYISNTIVGPVLGTVFSIALLFMDLKIFTMEGFSLQIEAAIPFAIGAIFSMMNAASTSVSMEGKEWWIVKSLPLTTKNILDGKLVFNLCLMLPFYVISEIAAIFALRPEFTEVIWMLLIPACIILLSCVFGITVNLLLPKLAWENEVAVVKQSASALIGGLCPILLVLPCALVVTILPKAFTGIACLLSCILFVGIAVCLYWWNNRVDLKKI